MAYYGELNEILRLVISERFLRNQDLCKLLHYYPENCIDAHNSYNYNPLLQPDIENTNSLYMESIFPMPKIPDTVKDKKVLLCAYFNGGYEPDKNLAFRNVVLNIDIICHLDVWNISVGKKEKDIETEKDIENVVNGFRPYSIMNEVDKLLNNQLTDLPIENRPFLRGFQTRVYSEYFYGIQMLYNLKVNSNIDCPTLPTNLNINQNKIYNPLR